MYEYGIVNLKNNEETIVFGRTYVDACRRAKLNMAEWEVTYCEYVD